MGKSFQFTPLREGRPDARLRRTYTLQDFNSRPSARGDMLSAFLLIHSLISIHAPPRGATHFFAIFWRKNIFQFTPLREGRRKATKDKKTTRPFQFTPLREGRPRCAGTAARPTIFQFTPLREGRRIRKGNHPPHGANFNSRPSARGDCSTSSQKLLTLFQFTPLREGRPMLARLAEYYGVFQFTPLREGRRGCPHDA